MAIPNFQTLMFAVLRDAQAGEVRIGDVVERLAERFGLSVDERLHLLPSGKQTTFANRVHWAKSYLGKVGLVELTRRAHFHITQRGREVLVENPDRIDIKLLSRFPRVPELPISAGRDERTGSIRCRCFECCCEPYARRGNEGLWATA